MELALIIKGRRLTNSNMELLVLLKNRIRDFLKYKVLCKSLRPPFDLLFSQGCNDNLYLFQGVLMQIQSDITGHMYTIFKSKNCQNKMASKAKVSI